MKIYIIKPQNKPINETLINNLKGLYGDIFITNNIEEADLIILSKNFSKSTLCIKDYNTAKRLKKNIKEENLYIDRYRVHTN